MSFWHCCCQEAPACGSIVVTVDDPCGGFSALFGAGAVVTVKQGATTIGTCTTDATSKCTVSIPSAGSYDVTVTPPADRRGYAPATKTVSATCQQNNITINMGIDPDYRCESVGNCCSDSPEPTMTLTTPLGSFSFPAGGGGVVCVPVDGLNVCGVRTIHCANGNQLDDIFPTSGTGYVSYALTCAGNDQFQLEVTTQLVRYSYTTECDAAGNFITDEADFSLPFGGQDPLGNCTATDPCSTLKGQRQAVDVCDAIVILFPDKCANGSIASTGTIPGTKLGRNGVHTFTIPGAGAVALSGS